ncbi:DsrE family protein [Geofilum sp. OHC36d9]|uniref:DsrE family protein n=1 Tax=Geofilum sp. OHC36d9 TaxID=3458413 RepID=UPI0040338270
MKTDANKLAIVWSSADKEVAERVVLMYAQGAKTQKWFEEITVLVWGPATKTLAHEAHLQNTVKEMLKAGINIKACSACSESYGVTKDIEALGIEVVPLGPILTDYIKNDYKILTF